MNNFVTKSNYVHYNIKDIYEKQLNVQVCQNRNLIFFPVSSICFWNWSELLKKYLAFCVMQVGYRWRYGTPGTKRC